FRDGTYRTDVAAAGKVYRQYRGRGRPRYKVQKKQNRPKDRSRSRGVVMRSQGSPRTTRPFRTGAVTKFGPLGTFPLSSASMHQAPRCRARTPPAMKNGRCWMHGGPSPGAPKGNKNALKHGRFSVFIPDPRENKCLFYGEFPRLLLSLLDCQPWIVPIEPAALAICLPSCRSPMPVAKPGPAFS